MANLYNWRFFQDTGLSGGTANPADLVFYIDSYNGLDTNVGSYNAPFQTIQKALDSSAVGGADFILAGNFAETGFLNQRNLGGLIPEGKVELDGSLTADFFLFNQAGFGRDYHHGELVRNYGRLSFKNFLGEIKINNGAAPASFIGFYNCDFFNCDNVGGNSVFINKTENCTFKNCNIGKSISIYVQFSSTYGSYFRKCTFFNTKIFARIFGGEIKDCYFDPL